MTKYLYFTTRDGFGRELTRNTPQFSNTWSDSKKHNTVFSVLNANSIEFDENDIEFRYDNNDIVYIYHLPLEAPVLTFGPRSSSNRVSTLQNNFAGSSEPSFTFGYNRVRRNPADEFSFGADAGSRKYSKSKRKSSRKSASRHKSVKVSRRKSVKVSRRKSSRKSASRRKSSRKSASRRKSVKVSRRKSSRKSASRRKSSRKSASRRKSSRKNKI